MKLVILNAIVCDPQSAMHGKKCDLLISSGIIDDIQPSAKKVLEKSPIKTWDVKGALLSPGWFDMRASLREPGMEHKETLESGARAAAAGGFTRVACLPDTKPAMQTKADIEFIYRKSEELPVHLLPYGSITKDREGTELNELYDMHLAGAIAFTDANRSLMHAGVMLRAMQYAANFGGILLSHAQDQNLAAGGRMNEGTISVNLGLKGIPNIAEEVMVARDIELAKYNNAPLHFSHISSKGSVEQIRKARKQGLQITADVAVASLVFTDENLNDFDSNFKVLPPLRGKADQKALWDGIADGIIDCIVSDHQPEDTEHKNVEFEYAAYGMIQLQTAYAMLNMFKPKQFDNGILVKALAINPRKILNQPGVSISKGACAEITIFEPNATWQYSSGNNLSKSVNSPVLNQTLTGKVLGIINKNQLIKTI
ncbi:MAG: dihydroorotase [Bacteroidota bacterium]